MMSVGVSSREELFSSSMLSSSSPLGRVITLEKDLVLFGDSSVLATEANVKATQPLELWRLVEAKRGDIRVSTLVQPARSRECSHQA